MLIFRLEQRGDKFAQLRRTYPNKARIVLDKHVDATIDLMKQLAPVDTGFMRDSIDKVQQAPLRIGLTIGAFYWHFVNYGTVNQEAQPFVEPAIDSGRAGFVAALKKAIRES